MFSIPGKEEMFEWVGDLITVDTTRHELVIENASNVATHVNK